MASSSRLVVPYTPILKGKAAEFAAWGAASQAVRASAAPLFEVPPTTSARSASSVFVTGLRPQVSGGDVLAVDTVYIARQQPVDASGLWADEWIATAIGQGGVRVRPTVRLDDPPALWQAAGRIAAAQSEGVVLRLGSPETDPSEADSAGQLPALLAALGLGVHDVHLLIDLFEVRSARDVSRAVPVADRMLAWAQAAGPWASVAVAAGAFPAAISDLPLSQAARIPRADADLWSRLSPPRGLLIGYGDYTVSSPFLAISRGRGPLPALRYTLDTEWLIWREPKRNPGNSGFFDVAAAVAGRQAFYGASFSWGDQEITRCATSAGSPGRAQEWRAYGTSHHLALITSRLSRLGAP